MTRLRGGAVPAGLAVLLALGACTAGEDGPRADVRATTAGPAPTATSSGTPEAGVPATAARPTPSPVTGVPGAPQDVVTGLDVPWSVAVLPDGSALVSLRDAARLVRVAPDGAATPVRATGEDGRVPGVRPRGEGGLLGVAVSPAFAEDGLVYLYLTAENENRVVRARLDGDALGEPETLVDGIPAAGNHNGGRLAFGPDGMLYVTTGDAQDGRAAQDTGSLAGKILRVTPDGEAAPGNPFAGSRVWSLGHRNVQGIGWDDAGLMFASEFGQNTVDELNLIEPGGNYGWPRVEGAGGVEGLVDPLVTWPTDEASPSGLLVTGDAVYLAALRGERLWRVPLAGGRIGEPEALLTGELGRLRDVVVAPGGDALWVLTNNTARGEPRAGDDRLVRLPLS